MILWKASTDTPDISLRHVSLRGLRLQPRQIRSGASARHGVPSQAWRGMLK